MKHLKHIVNGVHKLSRYWIVYGSCILLILHVLHIHHWILCGLVGQGWVKKCNQSFSTWIICTENLNFTWSGCPRPDMCKCCMLGFLCSGFRTFQQTQHCRWLLRGCPPGCRIHLLSFKNTIYEALWWDWIGWDGICIYRWSSNKECKPWVDLTLNTTCAICWPGDTFFTWRGCVGSLENHLIKSCAKSALNHGCEPERTLHRWGGRGQHRQTARSWQHRLAPQSRPLDTPRDPEPKDYGISRRIHFCRSTLTTMSKTPEMSQVRLPCKQEGKVSPGNWACV